LLWGPDARASALAAGGAELEEVGELLGNWDALAAFLAFRQLPQDQQDVVRGLEGGDGAQAAAATEAARAAAERLPAVLPSLDGEDGLAAYAALAGIVAANATENSDGRRALYDGLSMAKGNDLMHSIKDKSGDGKTSIYLVHLETGYTKELSFEGKIAT